MTQEQKDLLLKDLCARLPYGVKGQYLNSDDPLLKAVRISYGSLSKSDGMVMDGSLVPWLFPLSSMTEEQKQEYTYIVNYISPDDTENWKEGEFIYVEQFSQLMHFYHINHLDYMGLIPMGLAIDATGLNIY